jgi:peptide/nickel transport system substrate-binding protein
MPNRVRPVRSRRLDQVKEMRHDPIRCREPASLIRQRRHADYQAAEPVAVLRHAPTQTVHRRPARCAGGRVVYAVTTAQQRSTVALIAIALLATSCTAGTQAPPPKPPHPLQTVTIAADSRGPAPPVAGAKRGGTVTALVTNEFEHLDPARAYLARAQLVNLLLHRTLTALRHRADGQVELVGDLATDTGRASDGGRTWTFTLREGLKFEDGTPITASDVAYGIARSFSPTLSDGPTWLQQWLTDDPNFRRNYAGPFDGGPPTAPGVTTPDTHTITLRFARPQPDVPFAVTLGNTAPVPRAHDTQSGYDTRPMSSGPYRIEAYQPGDKLVLARNVHWDPPTDPLRTAYPDRLVIVFRQSQEIATQRVLAGKDGDQAAVSLEQVPPELLNAVATATEIANRATVGTTPYVGYLAINTQRVTDVTARRALNCAFDRDGYIKAAGGPATAEPATTLLPRIVAGYHQYNAYDCGPSGDPDKAKRMLAGRNLILRYGFRDNDTGRRVTAFITGSLHRAGFTLQPVPIDPNRYYSTIGTKDNGLDLYLTAWGADWPTGAAVIPALFDGRTIAAHGNSNKTYFNDDGVNADIDRIRTVTDLDRAAQAWGDLDEKIMREHAPLVPVYYDRTITVNGGGIGGTYLHEILGLTSLLNVFVS